VFYLISLQFKLQWGNWRAIAWSGRDHDRAIFTHILRWSVIASVSEAIQCYEVGSSCYPMPHF